MRVVAYVTHDQVPRNRIWVAFIVHEPTKAHPLGDVHPVYFHGATEREVRAAAETWWTEQLAAEQKRREPRKRKSVTPEAFGDEAI